MITYSKASWYTPILIILVLVLSACGGGGGGGSTSSSASSNPNAPTTVSVTGVVVDGYLKDAQVFLDLNDNGKLDTGEPSANTDASGIFKFDALPDQASNHAVIALALAGKTIDSDSPSSAITKSFSMTAPNGKYQVISPVTTIIVAKMRKGQPLADAEKSLINEFGINGIDPYRDYSIAQQTDATYKKVKNIASAIVAVLKSVEANVASTISYTDKMIITGATYDSAVYKNIGAISVATSSSEAEYIAVSSGALLEDTGKLLATMPKLLPDLKFKYDKLCGTSTSMQNAIPIDLNMDGRKDLLLNLWCGHKPSGEPYTGDVPNTLIALIQDQYGNFSDQTKIVFGSDMPRTDGKGHIYVVHDFNGDGYQDIVMSTDREDGRSIAGDNADNLKSPTLAIMSNANGNYSITTFGDRLWGSSLSLVKNTNGKSILIVTPAGYSGDPQAWIYDNGWQKKAGYSWVSNFSNIFLAPKYPDTTSSTAANAIGNQRGQFIQIWNRAGDVWTQKSEVQFSQNQNIPYVFADGKTGTINAARIFNRDYIEPMLYEGCSFKPTPTSTPVPIFSMLGREIVGGYTSGQVLREPTTYDPGSIDLVTFDLDQNLNPININSIARSNMDGNFWHILCEDVNSDGFDDIIIIQNNRPIIFLNDGKGMLKKVDQSIFPNAPHAASFVYEDLDGDGIRDFLYYPMGNWLFEDSPGQISTSVNLRLYKGIRNINQNNIKQ